MASAHQAPYSRGVRVLLTEILLPRGSRKARIEKSEFEKLELRDLSSTRASDHITPLRIIHPFKARSRTSRACKEAVA